MFLFYSRFGMPLIIRWVGLDLTCPKVSFFLLLQLVLATSHFIFSASPFGFLSPSCLTIFIFCSIYLVNKLCVMLPLCVLLHIFCF